MSRPLSLLLVEDSEADALLIERVMRRDGLEVACTRVDSLAALTAALQGQAWDVILSDYRLPGFTGLEALPLVRARGLDIPFIIVSGTIGEESAVAAMKAGAHDYVLKDDLARLGPALRRELREAENRRERRAAAEALQASEQRLRLITDGMLDLISEIDVAGRLRYASPSHQTTLGYEPAALIGQSVFDYLHPEDRPQVLEAFQAAAALRQPASVACRFRHAAGHYVWVESSGNPLLDEAGQLIGAVLSSRDVTARRQAEAAEREQRALAEALGDTAAVLNNSLDLPVVLQRVLDNVGRVVPHDAAMIMLVDGQAVQVAACRGFARFGVEAQLNGLRLTLAEAPNVDMIIRAGHAIVVAGPHHCPHVALNTAIRWSQVCVGAPLRHRGQTIGLISLHGAAPDAFGAAPAARLQAFADQAATAIINARLFESERQRAAELERANALMTALAQVSARIETAADPDQAMKTLGEALRQLRLQCFIALLRPDDPQLVLRYTNLGAGAQALASQALGLKIEGYCFAPERYPDLHDAVQSRRPLLFTEVQRRLPPAWQHVPQALAKFALNQLGLRPGAAFAVIPLIVEEQVQGVLGVWGADLREVDMAPLSVFAGQLATALERLHLLEAERRRAEELDRSNRLISALADVAARIQGSAATDAVLETLGTRLEPLGVACLVALPSPDGVDLEVRYLSVDPRLQSLAESLAGLRLNRYRVPRRAWIVGECLDRQQPVFSRDLPQVIATMLPGAAGGVVSRLASLFGMGAGVAMLYLPLRVEDQTLGLLALWGAALQLGDVPAYTVFAGQVAIALRNAQLVAHLEQARQAAEEANRLKSLFLANVSHELRTPLTGILGSLDLILDGMCDSADEERKFLHLGRDAGQRLLKLINDLLDLARIEAGQLSITLQAIDLAEVLAEVCMLCRPLAEAKQLALALDLPPAGVPLTVQADPDRLNQIMLNLVGNAVKFTEAGAVTVSAVTDPAAACVHIRIQDTGIGIPAAVQEQLFRPFVQADATSTRKYGGTGLGLAISRRLAELMRGRITLHSAGPGAGSTFIVSLPLADRASAGTEPRRGAGFKEARLREAQV